MRDHRIRIACPLLADEDEICGQPIRLDIDPGQRATRDDPGCGPSISGAEGPCRHVRLLNDSDLPEDDEMALLEAAAERDYELEQEALEARSERD